MSAVNINYQSPLTGALLTPTRFKSALARGDLSLLTCHVQINQSIDQSIKTAIREMLSQLTIEFSFTASIRIKSLVIIHSVDLTYEQYKLKHELYQASKQSNNQSNNQPNNQSNNQSNNQTISFENPSRVLNADSPDVLANGFLMLTASQFCDLVQTQSLDDLINQSLDRCKMVHIITHGLPLFINQSISTNKASSPYKSLNDFMSSITSLWLNRGGRVQFHWQSVDEFAAAKELSAAIRQTCAAQSKQSQEAAQFQFGSMRAVKARTAAMKGTRQTSKKSGRSINQSIDQSINQDSDEDDSDSSDGDAEDLDESWRLFLSLIRGVSEDKAVVIARAFPTLRSLLDHYKRVESTGSNGIREGELALADLRCGNRRIGEQISRRVHKKLWTERSSSSN